jgi:flagellar hook-associated protein 1 FlgK
MSFLGLATAGSALGAYQQAEDVTSQNISDVSVPGASRQIANLAEAPPIDGSTFYPGSFTPGTVGTGTLVQSITRVHQDSYDSLFRGATSSQNFYSVEQSSLQALQSALGEPSSGINTAFTNFQTAVQSLVNNPSGIPERNGVLTSAQGLVTSLNTANQAIVSQQTQVQQQASSYISTINTTLDQIAQLNGQIRAATAVGDNPNTYKDQRDQLIDTLSQYVSTQTFVQADGSTLVTVDGKALVNDTVVYHLAAPVVGTNPNGTPVFEVGFTNDPNPSNPTGIVTSGKLGGLLDLYNNKLIPYANQINNFANGLASEADRISQAGYDLTGQAGGQLFSPVVTQLPISAGNIQVGITTASEFPAGLASTSAGTLVKPLNAANNTVDTTVPINANETLANPPAAAGVTGTLTIGVDGITQTYTYNTNNTSADTIGDFVTNFNAGHFGVTASFNSTSQSIVFTRDPTNIDLVHRAAMEAAGGTTTPDFTITDSNIPVNGTPEPVLGTASTSLLGALGASAISGVDQNASNAYGSTSGAGANALLSLFSASLGSPALQTTAGNVAATAPGLVTTTSPPPNPAFANIQVGQVLTIDAGTANQENVTVTAVNRNTGTISFIAKNAHGINFSITTAQTQTLQTAYANTVAQIGLDTQTAITGSTAQTTLASNINQVRQSTDGINIDEETQNLIMYQNAYAAAAHTISVLNQMLGIVVNLGN